MIVDAMQLAERGFHVFPCEGKQPLTKHGFKDASIDPEAIREWWSWKPHANIAISTGKVSNTLILDVDNRPNRPGSDSLWQLERRHGVLTETASVVTGSLSPQYYFAYPEGETIPGSIDRLAPGLEIKSDGQYVIAPPSIHPETRRVYEWDNHIDDVPLADPPRWLLNLIQQIQRTQRSRKVQTEQPCKCPRYCRRHDPLLAVQPRDYIRLFTREEPQNFKVTCPFHDDHHPSFHVFESPDDGWFCFQCLSGGSVIDLGERLFGIPAQGAHFFELRRELARQIRKTFL